MGMKTHKTSTLGLDIYRKDKRKMDMQLKGRRALVTGGTRGIGKAVALEFARQGADVVICGTNPEKLEQVKQELINLGVRADAYVCDVADPVQAEATVKGGRLQGSLLRAHHRAVGPRHRCQSEFHVLLLQIRGALYDGAEIRTNYQYFLCSRPDLQ